MQLSSDVVQGWLVAALFQLVIAGYENATTAALHQLKSNAGELWAAVTVKYTERY